MVRKFILLFAALVFVAGCGSAPKTSAKSSKSGKLKKYAYYDQNGDPANQDSIEDLIYSELSKRQQALLKKYGVPTSTHSLGGVKFDIPITMNEKVRSWIDYFVNGSGRKHYARYLSRSTRVVPTQLRILKENKMPRDLIFLSMMESGFNTHAYSSAAASGLWQFIRSTGRLYGLDSDYWIDERRDPEKATLAAAQHLRDLYQEFGDWYLAFAAYNAGAGKIRRAIEGSGSRNFWEIAQTSYIRQETKDYVPKILAAAIIGKSPEKYGFNDVEFQDYIAIEKVTISSSTDIDVIAECAGVDSDLIRLINPELVRNMTPPHSNYAVNLPRGTRSTFERKYARLDSSERLRNVRYAARKGESLKAIAQDQGVTLASLMNANPSLGGHRTVPSSTTLVVPRAYDSPPSLPLATSSSKGKRLIDLIAEKDEPDTKSKKDKKKNKAKPAVDEENNDGEMKVAWKEGSNSGAANPGGANPDPSAFKAPEEAKAARDEKNLGEVKAEGASPSTASPSEEGGAQDPSTGPSETGGPSNVDNKIQDALARVDAGSVSEGETDGGGVRVKPSGEEGRPSKSKAEARRPKQEKAVTYKVKKGETLANIAEKYNVSVSDLKEWNRLKGKKGLLANQKLVIRTPSAEKEPVGLPFIKSAQAQEDSKSKAKAKAAPSKSKVIAYKVRRGDTIHAIAKKYDVTASQILALNGLSKKSTLKPGLVLKIPSKVSSRG